MTFAELPYDVRAFQAIAIKIALRAWAKHKMKVNRMYTPKNMLATATMMTGKKYKIGEYLRAADDIEKLLEKMRANDAAAKTVARIIESVK